MASAGREIRTMSRDSAEFSDAKIFGIIASCRSDLGIVDPSAHPLRIQARSGIRRGIAALEREFRIAPCVHERFGRRVTPKAPSRRDQLAPIAQLVLFAQRIIRLMCQNAWRNRIEWLVLLSPTETKVALAVGRRRIAHDDFRLAPSSV
jgi:hypothetical protein